MLNPNVPSVKKFFTIFERESERLPLIDEDTTVPFRSNYVEEKRLSSRTRLSHDDLTGFYPRIDRFLWLFRCDYSNPMHFAFRT